MASSRGTHYRAIPSPAPFRSRACDNSAPGPLQVGDFAKVEVDQLRPLTQDDYLKATAKVRPSVSAANVQAMKAWGEAEDAP